MIDLERQVTYPNDARVPVLSASKIKLAKTCAKRYYYRYIMPYAERPIERKNLYALRGTALHKAIEEWYRSNTSPAMTYQNTMTTTLAEWEGKKLPVDGEDQFGKILRDGKAYIENIKWAEFTPEALELKFLIPFPTIEEPIVMIDGIIDMITKDGKVIDHKSNSKKPNSSELEHDPQFIIYAWAYLMIFGSMPTDVEWHHLKDGSRISSGVLDNFDKKLQRLTEDIIEITSMVAYPRRLLDSECRSCPFYAKCYE